MGNAQALSRAGVANDRGSLLLNDHLRRYSSTQEWGVDGVQAALVVTDVVGSTAAWQADDRAMVDRLLAQNERFRALLEAANAQCGGDSRLLKVNEIGDSWVVVAVGPRAARLALRFAEAAVSQAPMPIRCGVHFGAFSIVRLDRHDANGFLPTQYECFGLTRHVLDEVKQLEASSAVGGVRCSAAHAERAATEAPVAPVDAPVARRRVVPVRVDGFVLFVHLRQERLAFLERMCDWGRARPTHVAMKCVSLEDEGRVWSLVAHDEAQLREWFGFLRTEVDTSGLSVSVVRSERIWTIHDTSEDRFQCSERYVAAAQNVAARLLRLPNPWGVVRSNAAATLRALLPHCDVHRARAVHLKGLGAVDVVEVALDEPPTATWFRCA